MLKSVCLTLLTTASVYAFLPTEQQTIAHRKALNAESAPFCTTVPEGGFVYFFHKDLFPYLEKKFTRQVLTELHKTLAPSLEIPLSREGFSMASTRRSEDEIDETNYSAIWVRDSCWHYFGLAIDNPHDAKTLLLNLLTFYATKEQRDRFLAVIADPSLADVEKNPNAMMSVPLIRFSRKTLSHHQVNGKDQFWNHLQFDSHGLFLLAVTNALKKRIISWNDLNPDMVETLSFFPAFFERTSYWSRKDAGPWEEELMNNASTVGLIAAGLKGYNDVLLSNHAIQKQLLSAASGVHNPRLILQSLSPSAITTLYDKGLNKVEFNLRLGCEAPDIDHSGNERRADAALLFLCLPEGALFYDNEEMIQTVLNITLGLVGPYGVYRYRLDAYQSMNYWIENNIPSEIMGKKTIDLEILTRFHKGYMPSNQPFDAQWFFDSVFAGVFYRLSELNKDFSLRFYYQTRGDFHLKRALGQFTGENAIAADGEKLPSMCLPESINTIFDQKYPYTPLPSPICPLSWANATMRIALDKAIHTH